MKWVQGEIDQQEEIRVHEGVQHHRRSFHNGQTKRGCCAGIQYRSGLLLAQCIPYIHISDPRDLSSVLSTGSISHDTVFRVEIVPVTTHRTAPTYWKQRSRASTSQHVRTCALLDPKGPRKIPSHLATSAVLLGPLSGF